jgi:hypothetical protein
MNDDVITSYDRIMDMLQQSMTYDQLTAGLPPRVLTNSPSDNFTISFHVVVKRGDKRNNVDVLNDALVKEALVTLANAYLEGEETIKGLDAYHPVIDVVISEPWRGRE